MGRNRRPSNEHQYPRSSARSSFEQPRPHSQHQQHAFTPELPGTIPTRAPELPPRPTHHQHQHQHQQQQQQQQQTRRFAPTSAPNLHIISPATTPYQLAPFRNGSAANDTSPPISPISSDPPSPALPLDVITALSTFRKARKVAYEVEMAKFALFKAGVRPEDAEGLLPPFVEGYWIGEIKVVRNAAPRGRSGVVDMYGNYFEKGYLYP